MINEIKKYILDPLMLGLIAVIIIGILLLTVVPIIFGFIFGAMAWLGLSVASRYLNKHIAGLAITVSKLTEAKRFSIVKLPDKYDVRFVEARGFKNVLQNIFLFNLLGSFMVVRYFGIPSKDIDVFISSYLLAVFIASIIALFVTPIAVNVSAIETTRFRVVDLDRMLMTYPAYLFYRVLKAIFGFGNLAVIVIILVNAITAAGGDILLGFGLFLALIITTVSSVALGSLIAVVIARLVQKDVVEGLMDTYDEALEPFSISSEEFMKKLTEEIGVVEEEMKEKPNVEEGEEKVEGEVEVSEAGEGGSEESVES